MIAAKKQDHDEDDDRKLTVHHKRHDQGAEKHSGALSAIRRPHHQDVLNLLDIVRKPRDERTGAVAVDVLKKENYKTFLKGRFSMSLVKGDETPSRKSRRRGSTTAIKGQWGPSVCLSFRYQANISTCDTVVDDHGRQISGA